jgi:hypothetical protein
LSSTRSREVTPCSIVPHGERRSPKREVAPIYVRQPELGVLILLLSASSLTFIDITGSIVYALVVPYAATALTLYYFDLQARAADASAPRLALDRAQAARRR